MADGSRNTPLGMNGNPFLSDCLDLRLDTSSNRWPLDEHHYADVYAVCMSIQTDDPPLWSGLSSSSTRTVALSENRGHGLNCHEDSHSLKMCRHPLQTLNGALNPDFGTLGDNGGAFRR